MDGLLTVNEVAELTRVTPPTVLQWIYNKRLKAYKAGGQWRITIADLQLFLKGATITNYRPRPGCQMIEKKRDERMG